jgi:hypothetical protein
MDDTENAEKKFQERDTYLEKWGDAILLTLRYDIIRAEDGRYFPIACE